MGKVRDKIDSPIPGINSVQEAAKRHGITPSQSANGGVGDAINAYEKLVSSGKASAHQLQDAFLAMTEEIITSNDGQVSDWLPVLDDQSCCDGSRAKSLPAGLSRNEVP
jgi:hypothetical protein